MSESNKNLLPSAQDGRMADDITRIRQAISQAWDIPLSTKEHVKSQIETIISDKTISPKDRLSAMRLILEINKLDMELFKIIKEEAKNIDNNKDIEINIEI